MLNQSSKALFILDPYKSLAPLISDDSVKSNEEQKQAIFIPDSGSFRPQLEQYNRETLETFVSEESHQGVSSFTTLQEKMLRLNQSHSRSPGYLTRPVDISPYLTVRSHQRRA